VQRAESLGIVAETRHEGVRMADDQVIRVGQAAEMLGVTVETLRRWEADGRLTMARSTGGQRLVPLSQVTRLLAARRRIGPERTTVARSARNQFEGIVTRIERDRLVAIVEVLAGPHRIVSLMTTEAVDELGLAVGGDAVCIIKATNVIVEVPSTREAREGRNRAE
jgi:molybdopterin-binding protein